MAGSGRTHFERLRAGPRGPRRVGTDPLLRGHGGGRHLAASRPAVASTERGAFPRAGPARERPHDRAGRAGARFLR